MTKHGMQMGGSGYGMSHGFKGSSDYERGDSGGSHGDYEHGVRASTMSTKKASRTRKAKK